VKLYTDYENTRRCAANVSAAGIAALLLGVILFIAALYFLLGAGGRPVGFFAAAAGLFIVLAVLLQIVAQLLHIRALLEEDRAARSKPDLLTGEQDGARARPCEG
jgi:UPF0716 family protein affecting phage T7 exclusion